MPGGFINLAHLFAQPYLVHAAQLIEQNARALVLKNHFGVMNVPTYQTVETSDGTTLTGLTEITPAQKSLVAALELTPPTPSDLAKPVL